MTRSTTTSRRERASQVCERRGGERLGDGVCSGDFPFGDGVLSPPDVPTLVDGGDRPKSSHGASTSQPALMPLVGVRRSSNAEHVAGEPLEDARTQTHANTWKNTETRTFWCSPTYCFSELYYQYMQQITTGHQAYKRATTP